MRSTAVLVESFVERLAGTGRGDSLQVTARRLAPMSRLISGGPGKPLAHLPQSIETTPLSGRLRTVRHRRSKPGCPVRSSGTGHEWP